MAAPKPGSSFSSHLLPSYCRSLCVHVSTPRHTCPHPTQLPCSPLRPRIAHTYCTATGRAGSGVPNPRSQRVIKNEKRELQMGMSPWPHARLTWEGEEGLEGGIGKPCVTEFRAEPASLPLVCQPFPPRPSGLPTGSQQLYHRGCSLCPFAGPLPS